MSGKDFIGDLLGELSAEGWEGIERASEVAKKANDRSNREVDDELKRQLAIVDKALNNCAGMNFMKLLAEMTVLRPETMQESQAATAEEYAMLKRERAGHNSIFFMLVQRLREVRGDQKKETT